jgi:mannose-6-phosphate isomerase-like protein (cupin superfamily)
MPQPEELGRNGTYMAFRKLHTHVVEFRKYLKANAETPQDAELMQAKMVGRWPSGAPLVLAPERDDPELAADPQRINDFGYYEEDPKGLKCPASSHIRRNNPRDALKDTITAVNIHRVLRRGFIYGPMLPEGQMEDDGVDRGIMFVFLGASIARQFEFLKSQWQNDGDFAGLADEKDPIAGPNDGSGTFTIPRRPVRRRLHGIPRFVTTRGVSTASYPASGRCTGWLTSMHEEVKATTPTPQRRRIAGNKRRTRSMEKEDTTNVPVAPHAQTQDQGQANQMPNGATARVLATGTQTGNAVGFMESTFPPGSGFPMHIHHNEDETLYILEGKLAGGNVCRVPDGGRVR